MVVNLFLTIALLSIAGSVVYILLKLLVAVSGSRLSQSWRYHSVVAVSLLFVLPLYKLWALIPIPHKALPPIIAAGNNPGVAYLPSAPPAIAELPLQVGTSSGSTVEWAQVIKWAAVLWLLVTASLILWSIWWLLRYRRMFGQASNEVNGRLQLIAQEAARLVDVTGAVRLLISPLAQSPMLVGFFRPTILLPSEHLPDSDARFILAHELTHFRRGDLWKKFLVNMIQCIHWFNPIVHLLNRDFAYWLETSCDEEVVSSLDHAQRKEYGYLLINYAPTSRHVGPRLYVSFTSCRYKLKRRISIMMKSNKKSRSLLGLVLALALIVGCLATTALAADIDPTAESQIDRDDATLTSLDDLQVAQRADWAVPIDLARDGCGPTFRNLSDIQVVENAEWASLVDDSTFVTLSDGDIMPLARGSLAPGKAYIYNSMSLTEGEIITLNATWTPSNASVSIGLWNDANSVGLMQPVSNGSGSAQFEVTKSGNFSLIIANTSAVSIDWDMSYAIV